MPVTNDTTITTHAPAKPVVAAKAEVKKSAWQKFKEGYGNASFLGLGNPVVDDAAGAASGTAGGAAATAATVVARDVAIRGAASTAGANATAVGASVGPLGVVLSLSVPIVKSIAGLTNIYYNAF